MSVQYSWLYQHLVRIYGADALRISLDKSKPVSDLFYYYPVVDGVQFAGWLGIRKNLLKADTRQLIQLFVDHQTMFSHSEDETEERYWKHFLQNPPNNWLDKWEELGYPQDTQFTPIYLYVDDDLPDQESQLQLKQIVESMREQKSFLLPLQGKQYVWILPDYHWDQFEAKEMLQGLADTIRAECMIDVIFYIGSPYSMPIFLREKIEEEMRLLHVALRSGWERPIIQYHDIIHLFLLGQCKEEDVQQLIERLLGPVKEDYELIRSIETYLSENLNVSETAKKLFIHRNSMQYRLDKFMEKTGLDIRQFETGVNVYLAIQALGMFNKK